MLEGHNVDGDLQEIAQALADSGRCEDCWDIEMELLVYRGTVMRQFAAPVTLPI